MPRISSVSSQPPAGVEQVLAAPRNAVQRPKISALRQERVGPASLLHREVRRDRGNAFELRPEPGDAFAMEIG